MNPGLALVMPAAGQGARFAAGGERLPKPLIMLHGRPFFWWATESLRRLTPLREMVYVVLASHVDEFGIDRQITRVYPQAQIVVIPEVTHGAAETASIGVAALRTDGPIAINDCDHAFVTDRLPAVVSRLGADLAGALMSFRSNNPAYSYIEFDALGRIAGTVEKQVISDHAIAGCYLFSSAHQFQVLFNQYRQNCPYKELFISGLYRLLVNDAQALDHVALSQHASFGTPDEFHQMAASSFEPFQQWKAG